MTEAQTSPSGPPPAPAAAPSVDPYRIHGPESIKGSASLVAGDDRGLGGLALAALVLVAIFGVFIWFCTPAKSWIHEFFFERRFVQWVLLVTFTIGMLHLLFRRLPAMKRERNALRRMANGELVPSTETLVGRRCRKILDVIENPIEQDLAQYAKHLAEHDDGEVDTAYRLSSDVIQLLPLMGFFGTVLGLSEGLYNSLTGGKVNTVLFAKSISVGFDNTLLGLALTILLLMCHSVLRKREEAAVLELNLRITEYLARIPREPAEVRLRHAIEDLRRVVSQNVQLVAEGFPKFQSLLAKIAEGPGHSSRPKADEP